MSSKSCSQPTGGDEAVALDLPGSQRKILRSTLTSCLEGVSGDLKEHERLPDPEKAQQEADAFGRLLAALDVGTISLPDEEARETVEAMVTSIEKDSDYARVIAEHDALFGLLWLLGGTEEAA
jgi:hypothetical protein